jgi:hypothetical protein
MQGFAANTRGVSEVVGYLLNVVIVGSVLVGVLTGATSYVEQRERVAVGTELDEHGQQLSRTVGVVDRLARQTESDGEIGRTVELPEGIGESGYRITVVNRTRAAAAGSPCDRPCLVLESGDVSRRVYVEPVTTLRANSVVGGKLYVVRPSGEDVIELRRAD